MKTEKRQTGEQSGPQCPVCGKPLAEHGRFCYSCCSFLDPATGKPRPDSEVTEDDLRELVRLNDSAWEKYNASKGAKITLVAVAACVALVLIGLIVMFAVSVTAGAIIIGGTILIASIVCQIYSPPVPKEWYSEDCYKRNIARYLMPKVWPEVFDSVESYSATEGMGLAHVADSGLIEDIYTHGGTRNGLKAVYRGRPLEFSSVALRRLMNPMEDDPARKDYRQVFRGFWLCLSTDRVRPCDLLVLDRQSWKGPNRTKINPYDSFEQAFYTSCSDQEYESAVLTGELQELLLELRRTASGRCFIGFYRDGRVELAVDQDWSLLDVTDIHEDPADVRSRMLGELKHVIRLADLLMEADV